MGDFLKALEEVKPAFGAATESLNAYCLHGIINCGENFDHLLSTLRMLVHQVGFGRGEGRGETGEGGG